MLVRPFKIYRTYARNAHHNRACDVRAVGSEARETMSMPEGCGHGKSRCERPCVLGVAAELLSKGVSLDVIGSDELACAELRDKPGLNFLNLRGDQRSNASFTDKMLRVIRYYAKLIGYAATAKPKIFHVLWNNKFETFDRTLLMLYYRFLGKRVVLTAHNVNADKRDSKDTFVNRLTLRIQYRLADAAFLHTPQAQIELLNAFGVKESRVTVIPFGINNTRFLYSKGVK